MKESKYCTCKDEIVDWSRIIQMQLPGSIYQKYLCPRCKGEIHVNRVFDYWHKKEKTNENGN